MTERILRENNSTSLVETLFSRNFLSVEVNFSIFHTVYCLPDSESSQIWGLGSTLHRLTTTKVNFQNLKKNS